ncbi:hypothetical protein SKAU_G00105880 [Synaphobranchus kaupii]|uniref:Uncharacterized protein n=1 Tax=Synaphobranchus kaupii TaxID=118154 RepID=A0A9Q1J5R2_SYNKA|nr:hypothetical protein SKAU_G00105880 [Synaphobranchus kaupii]
MLGHLTSDDTERNPRSGTLVDTRQTPKRPFLMAPSQRGTSEVRSNVAKLNAARLVPSCAGPQTRRHSPTDEPGESGAGGSANFYDRK